MDGIIAVQASWLGNRQYNGATSAQTNVIVFPAFVIALIVALVLAVVMLVLLFVKTRRKKPELSQPTVTEPYPTDPSFDA